MHFYGEMHTGRRVNWLYSKSKGEVVANCFSKKYTFVMSTYGIGILLQYNDKDSYKLHELAEATQLREDIVTQVSNEVKFLLCCQRVEITSYLFPKGCSNLYAKQHSQVDGCRGQAVL